MKTVYLTFEAIDAANPQAAHASRVRGGYRKAHLDRTGRPPLWEHCDADEFLAALDRGAIQPPPPERSPQTEGDRLRAALRAVGLSVRQAAQRIGMQQNTLHMQLAGDVRLRPETERRLRELIRETHDVQGI